MKRTHLTKKKIVQILKLHNNLLHKYFIFTNTNFYLFLFIEKNKFFKVRINNSIIDTIWLLGLS